VFFFRPAGSYTEPQPTGDNMCLVNIQAEQCVYNT
jgi:hypothetical protein